MRTELSPMCLRIIAEILEDHDDLVLAEVVAHPEDLDALTDSLVPFGIVDFQRTGRIAIVPPS